MGASASASPRAITSTFDRVDALCRQSYFRDHFAEYGTAVEQAVQAEALDVLEVLIPAGNIRKLYPLHISAIAAKLECLELFSSAGFSFYSRNPDSATPLHCCCLGNPSLSPEALLCATFLVLNGPSAVNMLDREGLTPLHVAVKCGNKRMLRLLNSLLGEKLRNVKNGEGKSCKQFAKQLKSKAMIELFRELERSERASKERLMKVWETFFENCFKYLATEASSPSNRHQPHVEKSTVFHSLDAADSGGTKTAAGKSLKSDCSSFDVISEWMSWTLCYKDSCENNEINDPYASCREKYYVVDLYSRRESRWLSNHLQLLGRNDVFSKNEKEDLNRSCEKNGLGEKFEWEAQEGDAAFVVYPGSLAEVVEQGWLPYYNDIDNGMLWMHLGTGHCETYLPLGNDGLVDYFGYVRCEEDPDWVSLPNYVSAEWVKLRDSTAPSPSRRWSQESKEEIEDTGYYDDYVLRRFNPGQYYSQKAQNSDVSKSTSFRGEENKCSNQDKISESKCENWGDHVESNGVSWDWYYYNRLTGHVSWVEPPFLLDCNGGWLLYCEESSHWEYYWYNEFTGESVWETG